MDSVEFSTLLGLVERYSPSGQEGEVGAWLVQRMADLGYDRAFTDSAGNAVGVLGEGPQQVILLGHIDTVPGAIPVHLEGDELTGRGTVDAKGPLAAFVDGVARAGRCPGWQFVVIGAVDEERDSTGARFVASQYRPDFAIIGEPSRWDRVTLGYKGSATTEITLRRPIAHSASQVESAPEAAFAAWGALRAWSETFNAGHQRVFDQITLALRAFSSGSDDFTGWAKLHLGVRLPTGFTPEDWFHTVTRLVPDGEVTPANFAIPAYLSDKNTPLVRAFLAGIRAVQGNPGFVLKTGTADLNIVAPAWGCPAVAYGPGDSNLDHTPEERISLAEYARSVQVLEAVLHRLAKGDGTS